MHSLVVVIILLSLIGFYINLGSITAMSAPELKREENKNMSPDEIAGKIMEETRTEPKFDKIGNSFGDTGGLEPGKRILNLNLTNGAVPNTRPYKWTTNTKREIGKYGLVKNTLSYKNNFPYDVNYLAGIQTKDTLRSKVATLARNPKEQAFRSQVVLPKDESQFKEGFKFTDRAIAIIRNQTSNENKLVLDVRKIDSDEVVNRASKKIYRVGSHIEIKTIPDILTIQAAHDDAYIRSKIQKLDPVKNSIDQMKSNYNFK